MAKAEKQYGLADELAATVEQSTGPNSFVKKKLINPLSTVADVATGIGASILKGGSQAAEVVTGSGIGPLDRTANDAFNYLGNKYIGNNGAVGMVPEAKKPVVAPPPLPPVSATNASLDVNPDKYPDISMKGLGLNNLPKRDETAPAQEAYFNKELSDADNERVRSAILGLETAAAKTYDSPISMKDSSGKWVTVSNKSESGMTPARARAIMELTKGMHDPRLTADTHNFAAKMGLVGHNVSANATETAAKMRLLGDKMTSDSIRERIKAAGIGDDKDLIKTAMDQGDIRNLYHLWDAGASPTSPTMQKIDAEYKNYLRETALKYGKPLTPSQEAQLKAGFVKGKTADKK